MRKISFLLCIFWVCLNSHAQKKDTRDNLISIGLKTGLNHSTFIYTESHLKSLPNNLFVQPNIGLFIEFHLNNKISIAPEFSLSNKGNLTNYTYENMYNVTYKVKTRYISTRLPIYYKFFALKGKDVFPYNDTSNDIHFFVATAPCFNYLLGGNIYLTQPGLSLSDININVGNANMRKFDIGIYLGSGVILPILAIKTKIELGYNIGLLNSFSKMEINEASKPTNINAYNIAGKRFLHSLEINISMAIPLKNSDKKDACRVINKQYLPNTQTCKKANRDQHKKFLNMPY